MTTATHAQAPTADRRKVYLVFAGLLLAMFLSSLDQTVFSTALPTIVGELHGVNHLLWVTTGYILASTVMMPVYGKLGYLTEGPGWRWAFWINVPLGLLAIAAAARFLQLPTRHHRVRLDVAGIATMAVAVTALVLVTSWGGHTYRWSSPQILGMIALAVSAGIAFCVIEGRAAEPVIPLHLFADRNFVLATSAGLVVSIAMFGSIGYLPTYLQMVGGHSATTAGLFMLPMMVGLLLTSVGGGQLVTRTGRYKWMTITSGAVVAGRPPSAQVLLPRRAQDSLVGVSTLRGL